MKICIGKFLEASEDSDKFDWFIVDRDGDHRKVKFYNDECDLDQKFYAVGFEYGPVMLIHTSGSEGCALDIFHDELTPIPMDEVHEAYNSFDKLLEHMKSKGHENTQQLRGFCNRWCKFYFDVDTRDANSTGAWGRWELDQAYTQQSNSTDSGIVHTGYYEWIKEIDPSEVFIEEKTEAAHPG